jgi:hypothetical protein
LISLSKNKVAAAAVLLAEQKNRDRVGPIHLTAKPYIASAEKSGAPVDRNHSIG